MKPNHINKLIVFYSSTGEFRVFDPEIRELLESKTAIAVTYVKKLGSGVVKNLDFANFEVDYGGEICTLSLGGLACSYFLQTAVPGQCLLLGNQRFWHDKYTGYILTVNVYESPIAEEPE